MNGEVTMNEFLKERVKYEAEASTKHALMLNLNELRNMGDSDVHDLRVRLTRLHEQSWTNRVCSCAGHGVPTIIYG